MIALGLSGQKRTLPQLASCSRALRTLIAPVLFPRCRIVLGVEPPPAVQFHVRHLRHVGVVVDHGDALESFDRLLKSFSGLTSIAFSEAHCLAWVFLKKCFTHPRLRSLYIDGSVNIIPHKPRSPHSASLPPIDLIRFSVTPHFWREQLGNGTIRSYAIIQENLRETFSCEEASLAFLVPRIHESVRLLALPVETAPVLSMAELSWPRLPDLSLHGRYRSRAQADSIPAFLSSISHLTRLSILVCRMENINRAPILGRHNSPLTVLSGLLSLTVAYPDPEDDIFSRTLLTSPSETALDTIISLGKVLNGDIGHRPSCADDELLEYIVNAYPDLSHIEIHRYRANRREKVDYTHIARKLAALKSLRVAHLNLDFHDDHGPYCSDHDRRAAWFEIFKNERGPEIVEILQACPRLEYVGLLYPKQMRFQREYTPMTVAPRAPLQASRSAPAIVVVTCMYHGRPTTTFSVPKSL
ncbi:hypothetical protein C8Q74DRAFT_1439605 [Fomes fomentarius]|nr:hypothetical protein C8Q74DRAFT_1439605 [Fomes fomentarius]